MSKAIRQPPLKSAPHLLCDWLELQALASARGSFRLGSLRRMWDVSRETENSDPEGLETRELDTDVDGVSGGDADAFIESITEAIGERIEALEGSYPFRLTKASALEVVGPPTEGGYTYLFCLMLTHANGADLLEGPWYPSVDHLVRDLFQGCSTLAAAAEVRGCAISFGWPRPNANPPFLRRLREVYELFGEGTVVDRPRRGVSPSPKDEEIDVIAWRPRPDRSAGTMYLLGQVASGDNWESKPIKGGPIQTFHRNWFQPAPASEALASIFIPHAVPPSEFHGTRRDRMDAITARYGMIIDRMRLPRLAQDGFELAKQGQPTLVIERAEALHAIGHWVNKQVVDLQGASA